MCYGTRDGYKCTCCNFIIIAVFPTRNSSINIERERSVNKSGYADKYRLTRTEYIGHSVHSSLSLHELLAFNTGAYVGIRVDHKSSARAMVSGVVWVVISNYDVTWR